MLLASCTSSLHFLPKTHPVSAARLSARTVDSFRFIGPATRVRDVTAKLGSPDRDVGSGIFIYTYRLTDGSEVVIGSADGSRLLYVKHGQDVLFEGR